MHGALTHQAIAVSREVSVVARGPLDVFPLDVAQ
jgi:hypothetical protein